MSASILDGTQRLALLYNALGQRCIVTLDESTPTPKTIQHRGMSWKVACTAPPTQAAVEMATWWASVPNVPVILSVALGDTVSNIAA